MQIGPNVSTLVDGWLEAGRGSDTVVIAADDRAWTADGLHAAVCAVAVRLGDLGFRREDRIMLVMDDTPALPAVFLGAMRIGAIPVPVNFLARAEDFGYFLDDSAAIAAVVDHAFLETVGPQIASRPDVRLIVGNGPAPDTAASLDEWMRSDAGDVSPIETHPDDMAFWLYSSGSTGPPKGVVHSHADISATCSAYAESVLGLGQSDVVFLSTKMFHAYGLGNSLSFPLWTGATSVYLTGRPSPDRLLERIRSRRPSVFFTVPALYNAMLANPDFDDTDWSVVRTAVSAAEPLPPEIWRQFLDRTGLEILDGIGSTELLHIYCSNQTGAVRPGTTGVPVDGYSLEIRDVDGELCDADEAGEMWVKGPSALSSYWHQPDRTRDKIRGDWFLSGDRYRKDAEGFYTYMGRVDDMMKVGGLWVSPIEIENRLMEHEAVQEAAVVAVEVDHRSRIKATVILTEGREAGEELTAALQQWCKARLQRHEFPHVVEVVADFPRTATGKIQRFRLRK